MGNNTPARSSQQFPIIPVVTLFGFLAVTLIVLLQAQANLMPKLVQPTVTVRPTQAAVVPTEIPPTVEVTPEATAEAVAVSYDPAQVAAGERVLMATCSACHGMNGRGIQGLGKDMLDSEFIDGLSDAELVAFIQVGRQPFDPLNTTGVLMPPSGGNPALTETDLYNVVAWIRVHAINPDRHAALMGGAAGGAEAATVEAVVEATPEAPIGTPTPYVLPIDRFNIGGASATEEATAEATPTTYVLPIDRFGARATATPGQ